MTKKKEKSIEIKVDVLPTEKKVKAVRKDLALILNDKEAITRAVAEANKHSVEGGIILGKALISTTKYLGPLASALEFVVDLSVHSKESVTFLERVQNKLIELSRAEKAYVEAKAIAGNKLKADEEKRMNIYARQEGIIENVIKKKEDERGVEIRTAGIRVKYYKDLNRFYEEELVNLGKNRKAYLELGDAIKIIESQKGGRKPIKIRLGGVDIKVQQKFADKAIENLKIQESIYAQKMAMAEEAMNAEQKSQLFHQEALDKSKKAETERKENEERIKKQANINKLTKEEELRLVEEYVERLAQLQEKRFDMENKVTEHEEELRNRKVEGLQVREAIQIEEIDKEKLFIQQREDLQQDSQGEQLEILENTNETLEQSEADSHKTRADQWQEYAEKVSAISQQVSEITGMVTNSLGGMFSQLSASYAQELESLNGKIAAIDGEKEAALERVALTEDERRAREEELAQQKINLEYATSEDQKNKADERIATLQGELGAEDSINRDFESKKASLEKEKEKKEKAQKKAEKMQKRLEMGQAIVEAIGNIAQGAAKALSMGPILGPILAAVVSAAGAIQVGVMTKQLAKMEDGGLLRGKRHAQGGMRIQGSNIEVEGGEYVVNRQTHKCPNN